MSDGPAVPAYGARRAMPLEGMLDRVGAISLDDLTGRIDGAGDFADAAKAARDQITALAASLLEPGMRPLVEWLCDITLRRPMILPNLGPEAVSYCALREGQNQIVWQLLRAAAEGRSEQIEPREGV